MLTDENYDMAVFEYAAKGDTETVLTLIEQGDLDIDEYDSNGQTALHHAAENAHSETVNALIGKNADVNQCDMNGHTALHLAAYNGNTETVKALLQGNADVNQCDVDDQTALHFAAYNGHTETVKALLQGNADVNECDKDGYTALYRAAFKGNTETVKALLQGNPDVNKCDKDGQTALDIAISFSYSQIAQTIQKYIDNQNQESNIAEIQNDNMPPNSDIVQHHPVSTSSTSGYIQTVAYVTHDTSKALVLSVNQPGILLPFRPDSDNYQTQHSASNQESMRPSEKELQELSEKVLSKETMKLGIELGVAYNVVEHIEASHQCDVTRQILDVLIKWRNSVGNKTDAERCDILRSALIGIGRYDLSKMF